MEYIEQDFFLQFQGVHLLVFDYNIFSYAFHGVDLAVLDISNLENFSESSFSNDIHQLEILKHCFVGLISLEYHLGSSVTSNARLDLILLVGVFLLCILGQILGGNELLLSQLETFIIVYTLDLLLLLRHVTLN